MPPGGIAAVVLAAGKSSRMGEPKALLRLQGSTTFLGAITATLRFCGVTEIVVVTGAHRTAVAAEAAQLGGATTHNAAFESGRMSSLKAGARAVRERGLRVPLLMWPVDCPAVRPATVARLLDVANEAHHARRPEIHVPVYENRGGHPIVLRSAEVARLEVAPLEANLRDWLRCGVSRRVELPVDDPAVLDNVDTLADYATLLAREQALEPEGAPA